MELPNLIIWQVDDQGILQNASVEVFLGENGVITWTNASDMSYSGTLDDILSDDYLRISDARPEPKTGEDQ